MLRIVFWRGQQAQQECLQHVDINLNKCVWCCFPCSNYDVIPVISVVQGAMFIQIVFFVMGVGCCVCAGFKSSVVFVQGLRAVLRGLTFVLRMLLHNRCITNICLILGCLKYKCLAMGKL